MRRSQRASYDYQHNRFGSQSIQNYEYKPKLTQGELRSLQCSSVQEVQPTNQSYENSWLQKLVNNMDEQKNRPLYTDTATRNFARKSTYAVQRHHTPDITNDLYERQRSAVSCAKKRSQYTPFSKINENQTTQNQDYMVSRFRNNDNNQRIYRNASSSTQIYKIERPNKLLQNIQKAIPKQSELNESNQSYGRIKKIQKQKQSTQSISRPILAPRPSLQQIQIPSIRLQSTNDRRQREKLMTEVSQRTSSYYNKSAYAPEIRVRNPKQYNFIENQEKNQLKRKSSEMFASSQQHKKRMEKYDYRTKTQETALNYDALKERPANGSIIGKQKSSAQKKFQKQDDFKMEEMAKRLNMVLQNINKKSKMIQSTNQVQQPRQIRATTSTIVNRNLQQRINTQTSQPYQQRYKSYSSNKISTQQEPKVTVKAQQRYRVQQSSPKHKHKMKTQQEQKYQMMKKSLGMSKHIPHQIILQESSSELNSQISPRTEYLNRQFRAIFDRLDKNLIGEINKNNCAFQILNDQIKYLFGGIFSKIKYKNEKYTFRSFLQECQSIIKQFPFQELKEVLNKSKSITIFKLNEKDVESQRWINETNNDSESKRSSDRSEVVKKYEFLDENKQFDKNVNENKQKVQWLPNQKYENLVELQLPKNKRESIEHRNYISIKQNTLETKDLNKYNNNYLTSSKEPPKLNVQNKKQLGTVGQKQNSKSVEDQRQKKDFQKMCENLNNKLNNYLTNINKKVAQGSGHQIPLEFSQLSKHWNSYKP